MKATLLLIFTLIVGYNTAWSKGFTKHNIEGIGITYMRVDTDAGKVYLYNTDDSLWKVITPKIPEGRTLVQARYASTKLFNDDTLVEVAVFYKVQCEDKYYAYDMQVVNELNEAIYNYYDIQNCILTNNDGQYRLALWVSHSPLHPFYKGSFWDGFVVDLPGKRLPLYTVEDNKIQADIYVNPNDNKAYIRYDIPEPDGFSYMEVYTEEGAWKGRIILDKTSGMYILEPRLTPTGSFYVIIRGGGEDSDPIRFDVKPINAMTKIDNFWPINLAPSVENTGIIHY